MKIIDLSDQWIHQARELLLRAYHEERKAVPVLPENVSFPALDAIARNGLGAAAVDGEKLLGFLGAYGVCKPVFYTMDVSGVFSPLHAHAVQQENREYIWRRLYQAAGEKWVAAGAGSHAITIYAHDAGARNALYTYGFGMRCMDLMRPMSGLETDDASCYELHNSRRDEMTALRRKLAEHLAQSPAFLRDDTQTLEGWLNKKCVSPPRIFVAERDGKIVAYMEVQDEGENFAAYDSGTMNICGAYCLNEYRGSGIARSLLGKMISILREEGYTRLGVDCESFNPTAFGFWTKYFDAYTHSVVRRIDENAVHIPG